MGFTADTDQPRPSTTWRFKRVIVSRGAAGQQEHLPKAGRWYRLPPRDARIPLNISVKSRGGPEQYYEIHARGSVGRFHGATALHDVMQEINRCVEK